MSTNYHWHKRQATERVQARLRDAEEHRRVKQGQGRSTPPFALKLIPVLVGVILAIWLLTGCTANDNPQVKEESPTVHETGLTMADRIRFQDKLEAIPGTDSQMSQVAAMSMAARIHFQDTRNGRPIYETAVGQQAVWMVAERIRFHDRLWEKASEPGSSVEEK